MSGHVVRADDSRRRLDPFRVLVDGRDSDGRLAVYTGMLPRGGPPRHVHDFDELVMVLSGRLLLELDGQAHDLGPGDAAWMPSGSRHTFANPSDEPVNALGLAVPDGILDLFADRTGYLAGLPADQSPDPDRIAAIYAAHASRVVGPPLDLA